ncbi:hypothetical protein J3R30DRAFT_1704960 [Lentinula aciculospora]|uniref:Conidiation-specific protein 6 n=1 Tax=Lentinula aciculospora TaxID=153920 RepID=A0A9W8ZVT0_9AGAR|nr:hypothetical protein J3R30DRAFT_1704960 [Lentinula aciculospora]
MADNSQKSSERVAAGLKGTLNNPNVFEGAKERASERLKNMGIEEQELAKDSSATFVDGVDDETNVEAESRAPIVLGDDVEDAEYESKPVTAEEKDDLDLEN